MKHGTLGAMARVKDRIHKPLITYGLGHRRMVKNGQCFRVKILVGVRTKPCFGGARSRVYGERLR